LKLDAALRDLAHADPRVRAQAADALGRAEDPAAVDGLKRAAADPHPSVRYAALLSLGELRAHAAAASAIAALDDVEPLVREAAAIALGQIGGDDAWGALAAALGARWPEVRFQALSSLVEIDAARAAPLVAALLGDADAHVRGQAAAALGDASDPAYAPSLRLLLDDVAAVRFEAALALARLGDRAGAGVLVDALDEPARALDAAGALAELGVAGDERALAALGRVVGRFFGDPLVKVRAAEALARAGDPRGRAHLDKAARARREDVRGLAADVLSRIDAVDR
jgi:HEAT repeat protein